MQRVEIIVEGHVQGIGFRYFIREHATRLGLKGYARNADDGSVEVVAEGTDDAMAELITLTRKGPALARVIKHHFNYSPYQGEFDSFRIQ